MHPVSDIAALAETFAASASSLPMPEPTLTLESVREPESQPKQSARTPESKVESREKKGSCPKEILHPSAIKGIPEADSSRIERKKEQAEIISLAERKGSHR